MEQRLFGYAETILKNEFHNISGNNFEGIIREEIKDKDIEGLLRGYHEKQQKGIIFGIKGYTSEGIHIKELHKQEHLEFPPRRFVNAINIHSQEMCLNLDSNFSVIPRPLGLIIEGSFKDRLTSNSNIYYLTNQIEGKIFLHEIGSKDKIQLYQIFSSMRKKISDMRSKGIYLMDIAPRDIVVSSISKGVIEKSLELKVVSGNMELSLKNSEEDNKKLVSYFCDTEEVVYITNSYGTDSLRRKALENQRKQFKIDYKDFVRNKRDLEKLVDFVIPKND